MNFTKHLKRSEFSISHKVLRLRKKNNLKACYILCDFEFDFGPCIVYSLVQFNLTLDR